MTSPPPLPPGQRGSGSHVCSGVALALARAAPDGIVSCAGGLSRSVRVPLLRSFGRNVTIHIGRSNARTVIPEVLAMMADGRLQPHKVTTLIAPLDDAVGAALVDVGSPFGASASVRDDGTEEQPATLIGYTIIEADDLAAAKALTAGLPFLSGSDGTCAVEIFELLPI